MRREVDIEEAISVAVKRGLKPGRVKGENMVYLVGKLPPDTIEIISWSLFRSLAATKGLRFFRDGNYIIIARQ